MLICGLKYFTSTSELGSVGGSAGGSTSGSAGGSVGSSGGRRT